MHLESVFFKTTSLGIEEPRPACWGNRFMELKLRGVTMFRVETSDISLAFSIVESRFMVVAFWRYASGTPVTFGRKKFTIRRLISDSSRISWDLTNQSAICPQEDISTNLYRGFQLSSSIRRFGPVTRSPTNGRETIANAFYGSKLKFNSNEGDLKGGLKHLTLEQKISEEFQTKMHLGIRKTWHKNQPSTSKPNVNNTKEPTCKKPKFGPCRLMMITSYVVDKDHSTAKTRNKTKYLWSLLRKISNIIHIKVNVRFTCPMGRIRSYRLLPVYASCQGWDLQMCHFPSNTGSINYKSVRRQTSPAL